MSDEILDVPAVLEGCAEPRTDVRRLDVMKRADGAVGRGLAPVFGAVPAVATMVAVVTAVTRPSEPSDTTSNVTVLEAPSEPSSSRTVLPLEPVSSTESAPPSEPIDSTRRDVIGALPDGTPFQIELSLPSQWSIQAESISAAVVLEGRDGSPDRILSTNFRRGASAAGEVSFEAGEWIVGIDVDDETNASLGAGWARAIRDHITASDINGYPVLELRPPFRFAVDYEELPLAMEVSYGDFVVRRGCGDLALRCSETGAVQLVPIDRLVSLAPEVELGALWVRSSSSRPLDQALDPGPLTPRWRPIVTWTGEELIVYGGRQDDYPQRLTDGAIFDLATGVWRLMPEPPEGTGSTVGGWVEQNLVVLSDDATMAFDPHTMSWTRIAGGVPGVTDVVHDGGRFVAWGEGVFTLDDGEGSWVEIEPLPEDIDDAWLRALRATEGQVYALGTQEASCGEFRQWRLDGDRWLPLPEYPQTPSEYAQCNFSHDSAGVAGNLLTWENRHHDAALYHVATDRWRLVPPPPLGGCEGGSGFVDLGERLIVDSCGAAMLDLETMTWREIGIPG